VHAVNDWAPPARANAVDFHLTVRRRGANRPAPGAIAGRPRRLCRRRGAGSTPLHDGMSLAQHLAASRQPRPMVLNSPRPGVEAPHLGCTTGHARGVPERERRPSHCGPEARASTVVARDRRASIPSRYSPNIAAAALVAGHQRVIRRAATRRRRSPRRRPAQRAAKLGIDCRRRFGAGCFSMLRTCRWPRARSAQVFRTRPS